LAHDGLSIGTPLARASRYLAVLLALSARRNVFVGQTCLQVYNRIYNIMRCLLTSEGNSDNTIPPDAII